MKIDLTFWQKKTYEDYGDKDQDLGFEQVHLRALKTVGDLAELLHGKNRCELEELLSNLVSWIISLANLSGVELGKIEISCDFKDWDVYSLYTSLVSDIADLSKEKMRSWKEIYVRAIKECIGLGWKYGISLVKEFQRRYITDGIDENVENKI
ncbi:hypothetical protein DRJ19_03105 [Candidatus Woesearchaeota archaeon]|nr:MAG: hypothetical protein DRJ19_03105 [Candidatus Woesearchaeota archaeon]